MDLNNLILTFVLVIFGSFFYLYMMPKINKYYPKFLIDDQFKKPQAFHENSTSITGGICIFLSFLIVSLNLVFFKNLFYLEYITFCILFFLLGLVDDLKINLRPKVRLAIMIVMLIFLIKYNNLYIEYTGISFLNNWLENSVIFSLFFVCLCFLFIINGANLIDGYNGLLGFHSLIILINLFLVNFFYENTNLAYFLFSKIIILTTFLAFNFPKAKVFLGDSGSYFLGVFIAISVIQTSLANPEISPFYFCILLFYLFFEVFFSFFRKLLKEKIPPLHPDKKHLHMLLYKFLLKKNNNKLKSNYSVSIIINGALLLLTIPAIFIKNNGLFCKYYSLLFFVTYIFTYKIMYEKSK